MQLQRFIPIVVFVNDVDILTASRWLDGKKARHGYIALMLAGQFWNQAGWNQIAKLTQNAYLWLGFIG